MGTRKSLVVAWFLFAGIALIRGETLHPVHNSILKMEFDSVSSSWQVMLKVFLDDLETDWNDVNDSHLVLNDKVLREKQEELAAHLLNQFRVGSEEGVYEFSFVGFELEGDHDLWFYFQCRASPPRSITVSTSLFLSSFSNQSNFVRIRLDQETFSAIGTLEDRVFSWEMD